MNSKKVLSALIVFLFVFSIEAYSQNFKVSPLIEIPGDNLEFDVLSPEWGIPNMATYICWINILDSIYTVYLKQLSPITGNNIVVTSDSHIKSRPRIAFDGNNPRIKIAWQHNENTIWQVYSKYVTLSYFENQLSDSTLILDSLETDPQISLSNYRLAWIDNGNLFIKEFYPDFVELILFDSLNCLSPELIKYDSRQETTILYEKDYTDSIKVNMIIYQHNENRPPRFKNICLSKGMLSKNPKFGIMQEIAFQTYENDIWKSEYNEFFDRDWGWKKTDNKGCNYYNPIFFTYPIPTSSFLHNITPFFLAFDSDSIPNNNEIFIKRYFYYDWDDDSLLNISQCDGNDYAPRVAYLSTSDSVFITIIWQHQEADKIDIWIAKDTFISPPSDVADKNNKFSFKLSQNYPNPFNYRTNINYIIPIRSHVSLKIFNLYGQEIKTYRDEVLKEGHYRVSWDGKNNSGFEVSSDIYIIELRTDNYIKTQKILFIK